jgi:DNA replication protein DnaC
LRKLDEARGLLESDHAKQSISIELQNMIAGVLGKCADKNEEKHWKSVRPAQEPNGFGALKTWVSKEHKSNILCWIDGAPGSGRSSLSAAVLAAWCRHCQKPGLFVSVRTFSQELKDTYYDARGWQNTDFQSERDRMAPLLSAPCLALDDFDRMDSDIRVVRAFAQLLDHRWGEELPTILTASKWAGSLESERDTYPMMKIEDASVLGRLSKARRVELVPTLSRMMKSL